MGWIQEFIDLRKRMAPKLECESSECRVVRVVGALSHVRQLSRYLGGRVHRVAVKIQRQRCRTKQKWRVEVWEVSIVPGGSRSFCAKRRWRKACRKFINIEFTTKMTRAGKQISPAESYYPYVMIWLIMYPGCIAIHHVHTHQSGGCSVRSFVGILNQSKPDLWNA